MCPLNLREAKGCGPSAKESNWNALRDIATRPSFFFARLLPRQAPGIRFLASFKELFSGHWRKPSCISKPRKPFDSFLTTPPIRYRTMLMRLNASREVFVELPHIPIRHTSVGYSDGFSVVDEIRLGWLIVVFNRRDLLGSFILEGTQSPV